MITVDQFDERVKALWKSQQTMAAAKYWKSGKRAGTVRRHAMPIEFTRQDLHAWLKAKVGANAVRCGYCGAAIDILSLTLDHEIPRSAGGAFSIPNLVICCHDCNQMKGEMTGGGYRQVLKFACTLAPHDHVVLLKRLRAAHHGAAQRFFRPKAQQAQPQRQVIPPVKQLTLEEPF